MSRLAVWGGGTVLVLALVSAGWFLTPYATVNEIVGSANSGDARGLSDHVDWAAVRQNASYRVKTCAADLVHAPTNGTVGATVLGILGAALNAVLDHAVDRLVAPESIAALIKAPAPPFGATSGPGTDSDKVAWKATDRVEVWVANGERGAAVPRLALKRQGLSWRIDQVMFDCPRLP